MNKNVFSAKDLMNAWEKHHISGSLPSRVRHKDLQKQLEQLEKLGLIIDEVGRSYARREIYQIEFGRGATKILMWSQMHGDEPTATAALIDMFAFLQQNRDQNWIKKLENSLTIRAVPMLNPDGADLFQRRNLQGIDINRDARALQTPEGRLLKKLRDDFSPEIGFNLHNQDPLKTVGKTYRQATISLLAVSGNKENTSGQGHERNKRLCAVMVEALEKFISGHVGRYDDKYNARAFGDMISAWGTPVILIETGALHGKDEKFLVKLNFIAYLSALQSLIDGSERKADAQIYENLPFNSSDRIFNVIFRQANIVNTSEKTEFFIADVAISTERRAGERAPVFVQDIGDLADHAGLDEYDGSDFYLVSKDKPLRVGASGDFLFYKKSRKIEWMTQNLEKDFAPDAIFKSGKLTKGEDVLPKK